MAIIELKGRMPMKHELSPGYLDSVPGLRFGPLVGYSDGNKPIPKGNQQLEFLHL
jgi:hypothetical protein